ncbi:MAG: hypothetical protein PHI05_04850 [Bacilli bacterium]|nr:hypothetical protein [Bacilli bacterium]
MKSTDFEIVLDKIKKEHQAFTLINAVFRANDFFLTFANNENDELITYQANYDKWKEK